MNSVPGPVKYSEQGCAQSGNRAEGANGAIAPDSHWESLLGSFANEVLRDPVSRETTQCAGAERKSWARGVGAHCASLMLTCDRDVVSLGAEAFSPLIHPQLS